MIPLTFSLALIILALRQAELAQIAIGARLRHERERAMFRAWVEQAPLQLSLHVEEDAS